MPEKDTEVEISLRNAVSREDVKGLFKTLTDFLKEVKRKLDEKVDTHTEEMTEKMQECMAALDALEARVSNALGKTDNDTKAGLEAFSSRFMADLEAVRTSIPELPPSFDPSGLETRISEVEGKIVPPQIAEDIRNGLEALPEGDKLVIDAIEGLREELDELKQQSKTLGSRSIIGHVQTFANSIITPSGDIDGVNTTYSFGGVKPTVVFVNGVGYREDHGWAFTNSNVVLDFAPPTSSDIYAIQ